MGLACPPRVEYSISQSGETIFPLLDAIQQWGKEQMNRKVKRSLKMIAAHKVCMADMILSRAVPTKPQNPEEVKLFHYKPPPATVLPRVCKKNHPCYYRSICCLSDESFPNL
jgi:hypothetical protein